MIEQTCDYANRDETIVTYLYGDLDDATRAAFDAHLSGCAVCRAEVSDLRVVRRQLQKWEAPAVASLQSPAPSPHPQPQGPGPRPPAPASWWEEVPMWARAAAAVLCFGTAAGLANLEVRYDREGFAVRTGWMAAAVGSQQSSVASQQPSVASPEASAPWRADLAALERQLRTEFRSASSAGAQPMAVGSTTPAMSEAELLRRVRRLVEDSERKQERELALRVGQVLRSVDAQRQSDLRRIDSNLGLIQNNTGAEVMRQRQMLINYLSRQASQK